MVSVVFAIAVSRVEIQKCIDSRTILRYTEINIFSLKFQMTQRAIHNSIGTYLVPRSLCMRQWKLSSSTSGHRIR